MRARLKVSLAGGLALASLEPAEAARRFHFDFPPLPLPTALARVGALTGTAIGTSDPSLLYAVSSRIHLDGTVGQVLAKLLAGTSAKAVRVDGMVWRIEPRVPVSAPQSPTIPAPAEIVVAGSKRGARLADYPASVTVISGTGLTRFGELPDNKAIERVDPTLQSTHLGPGRDKVFLRGIADSSFNGSSPALVGRYFGDLRLTYSAPDPNLLLYDVSTVEVLEGAQGTLYGAGSMAGLIRVTPRAPDRTALAGEAWAGATVVAHGSPGTDMGGVLNLPIAKGRAALRLLAYRSIDGGYIDNQTIAASDTNQTKIVGARAALRIGLGEQWLLDINGISQDIQNRDAQYAEKSLPTLTRSGDYAFPSSNLFRSGYAVVSGPVGTLRFTSTTGIIGQKLQQQFPIENGPEEAIYAQHDAIRLLSEEMRLSRESGGRLGWVAGLSIHSDTSDQRRSIIVEGVEESLGRARTRVTDLTGFGEASYHLPSNVTLTAGVRLARVGLSGHASGAAARTADKVDGNSAASFVGAKHEHFLVPTIAASWRAAGAVLFFARYAQAYRPGGLTASGVVERYRADTLASVELGARIDPEQGSRISLEISGVTSRWKHIQADRLDEMALPEVTNIGNGRVRSLTITARWKPVDPIEVKFAGTLASGTVKGFDLPLDRTISTSLPDVAHDTVIASIDYHARIGGHSVEIGVRGNHVGRSVLGNGSELSQIRQGSYWLAAFGAAVDLGSNRMSLYVENLLDTQANSFAFGVVSVVTNSRIITPLEPRSIRIGMTHRF